MLDRGIVLVSMAAAIALGATSMSDIAVLAHLVPVLGAAPSGPTVRRALDLAGAATLDRIARARARTRAHVWTLIEDTPAGFPWLEIAGKAAGGLGGHRHGRHPDHRAQTCTWHTFLTGRPPASWSVTSFRRVAVLKVTHSSVRWHLNSQGRKKVTRGGRRTSPGAGWCARRHTRRACR